MRIVLNSAMFNSVRFGPRNWLRPTFPNVPATGSRKALGLNHWLGVPRMTGPLKAGFRLGTSGMAVSPDPERFEPTVGVKGNPDCAVRMPFHCHPPTSLLVSGGEKVVHFSGEGWTLREGCGLDFSTAEVIRSPLHGLPIG